MNVNKFCTDYSAGECNFVLSERTFQAYVPQDLDLRCFSTSTFINLTSIIGYFLQNALYLSLGLTEGKNQRLVNFCGKASHDWPMIGIQNMRK